MENPSLPEAVASRLDFIREFIPEGPIPETSPPGKTHFLLWRVAIGDLPIAEAEAYMTRLRKACRAVEKDWMESYYIPVRDQDTSLVILNLASMQYVKM